MQKVAIIGAGNVGGSTAMRIVEDDIADVVLIDILENMAKAKALDIQDSLGIIKSNRKIVGSGDFSLIKDSQIVVITAGLSRKPGMTREELLEKNAHILKDVSLKIKEFCPKSIIIVVTNPVDVMAYFVYKVIGCRPNKILGMGSNLDTGRFTNLIAQRMSINNSKIKAIIIGAHGEGMLPLSRLSFIGAKNVVRIFNQGQLRSLEEDVVQRGAKIVSLLGTGSAYFGPSQAISQIINVILKNKKIILPVSCFLDGEYGLNDVFIGVPAKIGRNGVEEIMELKLNAYEQQKLQDAASAIKKNIQSLSYA